jgi:hypothetical protein
MSVRGADWWRQKKRVFEARPLEKEMRENQDLILMSQLKEEVPLGNRERKRSSAQQ